MGELSTGTFIEMRAVSRVPTSTSDGITVLYRGAMSTSSNVSPVVTNFSEAFCSKPHSQG
jgi:hypothetical protein